MDNDQSQLDRVEVELKMIQQELKDLKEMIIDIHKHVGFVDSLSTTYESIKSRGLNAVMSTTSLLSWSQRDTTPPCLTE